MKLTIKKLSCLITTIKAIADLKYFAMGIKLFYCCPNIQNGKKFLEGQYQLGRLFESVLTGNVGPKLTLDILKNILSYLKELNHPCFYTLEAYNNNSILHDRTSSNSIQMKELIDKIEKLTSDFAKTMKG